MLNLSPTSYCLQLLTFVSRSTYVFSLNSFIVYLLWWRIYECATYCLVKLTMSVSTTLSIASGALCTLPALWKCLCKLRRNSAPVWHSMEECTSGCGSLPLFLLLSQALSAPPPPPPSPVVGRSICNPVIIKVIFSRGPNPCFYGHKCVTGPWQ